MHSPTHPQHTCTQIGPDEYTPAESTLTVIQVDESEEQFNTVLLTVSITFTRNHGVNELGISQRPYRVLAVNSLCM